MPRVDSNHSHNSYAALASSRPCCQRVYTFSRTGFDVAVSAASSLFPYFFYINIITCFSLFKLSNYFQSSPKKSNKSLTLFPFSYFKNEPPS
nr:MAG TPA: hypothetical protein [Caudoviricetes sp.]